jgi:hypothetical protein
MKKQSISQATVDAFLTGGVENILNNLDPEEGYKVTLTNLARYAKELGKSRTVVAEDIKRTMRGHDGRGMVRFDKQS